MKDIKQKIDIRNELIWRIRNTATYIKKYISKLETNNEEDW